MPDLSCATVLQVGGDHVFAPDVLTTGDTVVEHLTATEAVTLQLDRRFDLVIIANRLLTGTDDGYRRAVMHAAAMHIERGGYLAIWNDAGQPASSSAPPGADLQLVGSYRLGAASFSLFRRGDRMTVHDLLFEARSTIRRVTPVELDHRMRSTIPPLVLDTRTHTDRERFGVIPGSVHVPRTVVEWHLDPANGYLHPEVHSFDQPLVLVCNGGYSSSLAAANLVRIGFTDVADLIGGHTAWCAAGLAVIRPDHSHLETPAFDTTSG